MYPHVMRALPLHWPALCLRQWNFCYIVFMALYWSTTDCCPENWYGCTYGRVSVFTCCRWCGEHCPGCINIKL